MNSPTTKSTITTFVDDVALGVLEVELDLRAKGFLSGFVDEDWMQETSSVEEWGDHKKFRVEYAREVICSCEPAAVLHSDVGKYKWLSKAFEQRVQRRLNAFGEAGKLFSAASTRPNIELTEARRRLSRVLEKSTPMDRETSADRERKVALLKIQETALTNDAALFVRPILLEQNVDEVSLNRACLGYVRRCFVSPLEAEKRLLVSSPLVVIVPGIICIRVHLDARIDKAGKRVHGAIFPNIYVSSLAADTRFERIRQDGFVYFHWMLAREFIPYSRFQSRDELIVCAAAWGEMLASTIRRLIARGWTVELDGCRLTGEPSRRH